MAILGFQKTDPDGTIFRPLSSLPDYEACIELQRHTWGRDFSDVVPLSILKVSQKAGGIAAAAFSPEGRMLGFIYGLAGWKDGRFFHWSHMMAVEPDARDLGLGTRLKLYQREILLPLGVEEIQWTYDPLEARNAHLNFNHLGVGVAEYVEDMYAGELWSDLAVGIGTDRFIVSWRIASDRVTGALANRRAGSEAPFLSAPVVNRELADEPRVRIEIPENIQAVKEEDLDAAAGWRAGTRRAFEHYLGAGYRVEAFYRNSEGCFYGLEKD